MILGLLSQVLNISITIDNKPRPRWDVPILRVPSGPSGESHSSNMVSVRTFLTEASVPAILTSAHMRRKQGTTTHIVEFPITQSETTASCFLVRFRSERDSRARWDS